MNSFRDNDTGSFDAVRVENGGMFEWKDELRNLNIARQELLPLPVDVLESFPMGEDARSSVLNSRNTIREILAQQDRRLMVIVGPCSIHDVESAYEYAQKLSLLRKEVGDKLFLVMRVYFEKPRTSLGWKGLINDPNLDGTFDIRLGLSKARAFLLKVAELDVPVATEALDTVTPQYIHDLVSWTAVGARTVESQVHREMASGLSTPVGFKNGTDGSLEVAINAMIVASTPQRFLGVTARGECAVFHTVGNSFVNLVLRGGKKPNYEAQDLSYAVRLLRQAGLLESLVVDCSHGNSRKDFKLQPEVFCHCLRERILGNRNIVGMMIESNLFEGNQPHQSDRSKLIYGVSITDACLGWEDTKTLILDAYKQMR